MQPSLSLRALFVSVVFSALSATIFSQSVIEVSDQKPGAILVFPYYTSKAQTKSDTRITLSNVGDKTATIHLFFLDGASCNESDIFLCLTPNASVAYKTSDLDPENTGWILAVRVPGSTDVFDGFDDPFIPDNSLIGNAFVHDGNYVGNYSAESFKAFGAALQYSADGNSYVLNFNDGPLLKLNGYDAAPNQFQVELQSPATTSGQKLIMVGLNGDIYQKALSGTGQIGAGQVINGNESPVVSFTNFLRDGCQTSTMIDGSAPRVPSGMQKVIPAGQIGTMQFRVTAAAGLLLTPGTTRFSGIRTLHKTLVNPQASITIPILIPGC